MRHFATFCDISATCCNILQHLREKQKIPPHGPFSLLDRRGTSWWTSRMAALFVRGGSSWYRLTDLGWLVGLCQSADRRADWTSFAGSRLSGCQVLRVIVGHACCAFVGLSTIVLRVSFLSGMGSGWRVASHSPIIMLVVLAVCKPQIPAHGRPRASALGSRL